MNFPVPSEGPPILSTSNPNSSKHLPEWSYKKFEITDIFYSKLGIAATTGVLTFAILVYINPPFVQQNDGSKLEIQKPSIQIVGSLSALSFLIVLCASLY